MERNYRCWGWEIIDGFLNFNCLQGVSSWCLHLFFRVVFLRCLLVRELIRAKRGCLMALRFISSSWYDWLHQRRRLLCLLSFGELSLYSVSFLAQQLLLHLLKSLSLLLVGILLLVLWFGSHNLLLSELRFYIRVLIRLQVSKDLGVSLIDVGALAYSHHLDRTCWRSMLNYTVFVWLAPGFSSAGPVLT